MSMVHPSYGSSGGPRVVIRSVSKIPQAWQLLDQMRGASSRGVWTPQEHLDWLDRIREQLEKCVAGDGKSWE